MKIYKITFSILISFFSIIAFSSCTKQEGQGGTSTIKGKIFVAEYNVFTPIDSFYSGKVSVYIIYGDNEYFGDKIESSYDGTFEFPYLKKGKYTLFAYSDCLLGADCDGGKKVIKKEVEITENKQTIDAGDIRIEVIQ
ncbi:hypothetical protein LBMAG27_13880 [Bacteroidota bacterium]|nr:hypothetical protein LBMAG27_13880 [Bacteroidota bacterium]